MIGVVQLGRQPQLLALDLAGRNALGHSVTNLVLVQVVGWKIKFVCAKMTREAYGQNEEILDFALNYTPPTAFSFVSLFSLRTGAVDSAATDGNPLDDVLAHGTGGDLSNNF